jgi:hypothetical protein
VASFVLGDRWVCDLGQLERVLASLARADCVLRGWIADDAGRAMALDLHI